MLHTALFVASKRGPIVIMSSVRIIIIIIVIAIIITIAIARTSRSFISGRRATTFGSSASQTQLKRDISLGLCELSRFQSIPVEFSREATATATATTTATTKQTLPLRNALAVVGRLQAARPEKKRLGPVGIWRCFVVAQLRVRSRGSDRSEATAAVGAIGGGLLRAGRVARAHKLPGLVWRPPPTLGNIIERFPIVARPTARATRAW